MLEGDNRMNLWASSFFPLSAFFRHFLIGIGYLLVNILFDKQLLHVEVREPLVAQEDQCD